MCVRSIAREVVPGQHAECLHEMLEAIHESQLMHFSGVAQTIMYVYIYRHIDICVYIIYIIWKLAYFYVLLYPNRVFGPTTPVAPFEIKRNGLKALHLSRHDCGKTKAEKPSPPPREKEE